MNLAVFIVEVTLASADAYFESQWGLENNQEQSTASDTIEIPFHDSVIEQIRMVLPHTADEVERNPKCSVMDMTR